MRSAGALRAAQRASARAGAVYALHARETRQRKSAARAALFLPCCLRSLPVEAASAPARVTLPLRRRACYAAPRATIRLLSALRAATMNDTTGEITYIVAAAPPRYVFRLMFYYGAQSAIRRVYA